MSFNYFVIRIGIMITSKEARSRTANISIPDNWYDLCIDSISKTIEYALITGKNHTCWIAILKHQKIEFLLTDYHISIISDSLKNVYGYDVEILKMLTPDIPNVITISW
jgi:hypothetical protein